MKSIVLALVFIAMFSCNSDNDSYQAILSTGFEFSIQDNEGTDLLDPENPEAFDQSNVKLFYKENGVFKEVYRSHLDYPRNVLFFKDQSGHYRIRAFLNASIDEAQPETLIKWNEKESDLIRCEIYRANSLVRIDKVWLNDDLIWYASLNTEPYFELTK